MSRQFLLILIFLFSFSQFSYCQKFVNIFTKGIVHDTVFLVDKKKKTLQVVQVYNDKIKIIHEYHRILIGEKKGDKYKKGDKRTPEGIYQIRLYIPPSKLAKKYGDGAYPLNYPNPVDKILGKTGGGIWIHGLIEGEKKLFTKGCVALHNGDLKDLSRFSPVGKYVIISKKVEYMNQKNYNLQKKFWLNFFNSYINSWQHNNFKKFSSFYHKLFINNKNQKLRSYLKIKRRLMKSYPYKRIHYNKLKIFKEDNKEVFIGFRQLYCAANLLNEGIKQLYLYKSGGQFKIIYEKYINSNSYKLLKTYIYNFIENWKNSWQSKNLKKYINFYSKKFKNNKYNFNSWKIYKSNIFKKMKNIKVKIYRLKFHIIDPLTTEITFIQQYDSDNYEDLGIKKLILTGCPGDYKIVSESWRKIK